MDERQRAENRDFYLRRRTATLGTVCRRKSDRLNEHGEHGEHDDQDDWSLEFFFNNDDEE